MASTNKQLYEVLLLLIPLLWFPDITKAQYTDTGSYPICYACGSENRRVSEPTATVMIPKGVIPLEFMDIPVPDITCGAIEEIGLLGQLPPFICNALQSFPVFQIPCVCAEQSTYPTVNPTIAKSSDPSSLPTTSAPYPMGRPTLIPTLFLQMPIQTGVVTVPSLSPSMSVFPSASPSAKSDLEMPTPIPTVRDLISPVPSQLTFPPRGPQNSQTAFTTFSSSPVASGDESSSQQPVAQPANEFLSISPSDLPSLTPSSRPSLSLLPSHLPSFRPRETLPAPFPNTSSEKPTPRMDQDGSDLGGNAVSDPPSCSMAFSYALQFCSPDAEEATSVFRDICNLLRNTCGIQEDRASVPTSSPTPAPIPQPQKCGLVGRASVNFCDPLGEDILSVLRAYCHWMRTTCSNDP